MARAFVLPQGLALIPLTDELVEALEARNALLRSALHEGHDSVDQRARLLLEEGPVAHIETDYFGGLGSQSATVWLDGNVLLGELVENRGDDQPISRALKMFGLQRSNSDEFDAIGLGLVRSTNGWLSKGTPL